MVVGVEPTSSASRGRCFTIKLHHAKELIK